MSVHTADSQFSFQLPSLSYIDAKWEEPNLLAPTLVRSKGRLNGLATWLSLKVSAFVSAYRNRDAMDHLASMSDRELMDIGLSRGDLGRVFVPAFSEDLRHRGS